MNVSNLLCFETSVNPSVKKTYEKGDWKQYAVHDEFNVKGFFGPKYEWLSNFYPCDIEFEGLIYPSTEHAYQAAKVCEAVRQSFTTCTATESKSLWKKYVGVWLLPNWYNRRVEVMQKVLFQKFLHHKDLQTRLIRSAPKYLEETNHWKDNYWGVAHDTGKGENMLGKILMATRDYFRNKHF